MLAVQVDHLVLWDVQIGKTTTQAREHVSGDRQQIYSENVEKVYV